MYLEDLLRRSIDSLALINVFEQSENQVII
jgi:hypothetical protein